MGLAEKVGVGALAVWIGVLFTCVAGWITHVIVTIGALVGSASVGFGYGALLALGVFVPPVGVIHGIGVWFGAW